VVHNPNTYSRKEHYGNSALKAVMQILDELQEADTDLALTSRTTGSPVIGSKGPVETDPDDETGTKVLKYRPGTLVQGELSVIDTSRSLDALLKYVDHLWRRLSVNVRVPEAILGRVKPNEVPSGFALALGFTPLRQLVRKMRLSRDEKYPLLFKFVARMAMQAGVLDANADLPEVRLAFGAFVPTDMAGVVAAVVQAYKEGLLSKRTAVAMLRDEAGMAIEDIDEELAAIDGEEAAAAERNAPVIQLPELGTGAETETGEPTPPPEEGEET
jgi:hypothetical protein